MMYGSYPRADADTVTFVLMVMLTQRLSALQCPEDHPSKPVGIYDWLEHSFCITYK